MLKRILSLAIVLNLTFATGIGVYATETEFNGSDTKDPLDDIIAMAEDVDQISIF